MVMHKCDRIQALLSFYLDDSLTEQEANLVEKHLEECSACRQELEDLKELISLLDNLGKEELTPPPNFRKELRRKIETEISPLKRLIAWFKNIPYKGWFSVAAAALVLVFLAPVFLDLDKVNMASKKDAAPEEQSIENIAQESADMAVRSFKVNSEELASSQLETENMGNENLEQKLIKRGYLTIEVDNYKKTSKEIFNYVEELNGYVSNENSYILDRDNNLLGGNIVLRIPNNHFDNMVQYLESIGYISNRSISSEDITEEYVDLQSRLKVMYSKEERLLALLEKSGTLNDVLSVENELATTRGDIESLEGRLKFYDNQVSLATLNVELKETLLATDKIKAKGLEGVVGKTKNSFIKSVNIIILGINKGIVYLGGLIPFLLCGGVVLTIIYFIFKKVKK